MCTFDQFSGMFHITLSICLGVLSGFFYQVQFLEDFWLREPKKQWWEGGVLDAICYGRLCRGLLRIAEDSLKVWRKQGAVRLIWKCLGHLVLLIGAATQFILVAELLELKEYPGGIHWWLIGR